MRTATTRDSRQEQACQQRRLQGLGREPSGVRHCRGEQGSQPAEQAIQDPTEHHPRRAPTEAASDELCAVQQIEMGNRRNKWCCYQGCGPDPGQRLEGALCLKPQKKQQQKKTKTSQRANKLRTAV